MPTTDGPPNCDVPPAGVYDGPPEQINDNPNTAPSKRIDKLFPGYAAAKTSTGVELAACIGLATVRGLCPHFDEWIGRLEALGVPTSPGA